LFGIVLLSKKSQAGNISFPVFDGKIGEMFPHSDVFGLKIEAI